MSEQSISQPIRFQALILSIQVLDGEMSRRTKVAVNTNLSLRNWVIGYYIDSYNVHGVDRGEYGDGLIATLSASLNDLGLKNVGRCQRYNYRAFYKAYPEILQTPTEPSHLRLKEAYKGSEKKVPTLSAQLRKGHRAL